MAGWRHRIGENRFQTAVLIGAMATLSASCALALWGWQGIPGAILAVAVAAVLGPAVPPGVLLVLHRARPLDPRTAPTLHVLVERLSARAGLARSPSLWWVPSRTANAFTVGRSDRAAIAVTDGLLRRLGYRELAGVLAHEIAHIAHDDVGLMSLADLLNRLTLLIGWIAVGLLAAAVPTALIKGASPIPIASLLLPILAPVAMSLLQLALSRVREVAADRTAVRLTGDAEGFAWALMRIAEDEDRCWQFALPGGRMSDLAILRSHPPARKRVRRILGGRLDRAQPPERGPAQRRSRSLPDRNWWLAHRVGRHSSI